MVIFAKNSSSILCACVTLGFDMIGTGALDPKLFANRFGANFVSFDPSFEKHLFRPLKTAKIAVFAEISASKLCACVHILGLERDMITAGSLDPQVFVNRLGDPSRKFKDIFSQGPFWAPENGQNRRFLKILKSILCACVCAYLFWGA